MALGKGARLGAYEIVGAIGAGGMGEVYRATDTKLGRDVALKVLPLEMGRNPDRLARFRREGRSLAALNHPNIVTIFSVEEADGTHFLTMELVEGQPLDRLIAANGLPIERIVEIAGAIADALAAAHEKGILHRDLKPANIMVSNEGRVKVLDFGLAKDVGAETPDGATLTSAGRTEAGVVMGTPAYMSPEQVSGRTLDHRSDIFSFGVMLHEMATGCRPFEGRSSAELISAILRDSPPSVSDMRPELPTDLARVIRRCLEKDPRYRLQTARDVANEFRDLARMFSGPSGVADAPAASSGTRPARTASGENRAEEGFWVAVLPFRAPGGDEDLETLADGLTEDITAGLSRFPYLQVIARGSATALRGRAVDIRTVGRELGARYVLEGSVRKRGHAVRVSAQLLDAASGTQLWAESYDREIGESSSFQIQDDLTDHIVTTVADGYGILVRSMAAPTRDRNPEDLSASELVLRYYAFMQQVDPQEHGMLRAGLERALEREPNHATAWACLSDVYLLEYLDRFNPREKAMERAREAAWRSVRIDPACQMGWKQLAGAHFFSRDFSAFREAAERALSLNPRDGITSAYLAILIAYSGDWERGAALAQRTMELNRHHPGWYHLTVVHHQYRKGEYEAALETAKRINMPEFHWAQLMIAAACGMLGRREKAQPAIELLRRYNPPFLDLNNVRDDIEKWLPEKDAVEQLIQGLQKAGLTFGSSGSTGMEAAIIPKSEEYPAPASAPASVSGREHRKDSGAVRADEGFWVAVLPFKCTGSNADLKALAEGLSEEVITGLSRFSYLRVIARGSTAKYSGESDDVRAIGKELGARYVLEGSLRQARNKLRLAVQLVDTTSGTHLWAETYERAFEPEALFDLQDELVPRIVSTVADGDGILPLSMAEALRNRSEEDLTAHEAVVRSFGFFKRFTPEEHGKVRQILETAVRKSPDHGDCWAMLSHLYCNEYWSGFNARPDPLGRGLDAARRAVDVAPFNHLSYWALALPLFFKRELQEFRVTAERCIELNGMDGSTVAFMGALIAYSGDWDRGCAIAEPASALNPYHAGWHKVLTFYNAYRKGEYREALTAALRLEAPGSSSFVAARAAAYGQLGEREAAQKAVKELVAVDPTFASTARDFYPRFLPAELVERLMDGLRKAGLEISGSDDVKQEGSQTVETARADSGQHSAKAPSGVAHTSELQDFGAARAAEGLCVAVLPFENASGDPESEYLSDGITETLINSLSQLGRLKVLARSTVFRYKGRTREPQQVGRELGANAVLTGRALQRGQTFVIGAELMDVENGWQLWGERYKRDMADIFDVQEEIAKVIFDKLRVRLAPKEEQQLAKRYTVNPEAYQLYLKGLFFWNKWSPEGFRRAEEFFQLAIEKDPTYVPAYEGLGHCLGAPAYIGLTAPRDRMSKAFEIAQKALALDDTIPSGHILLGLVKMTYEWNLVEGERCFQHAIGLDPNAALPRNLRSLALLGLGRSTEGISEAVYSLQLEAASPLIAEGPGLAHLWARNYKEAEPALRSCLELDPKFLLARLDLGETYAVTGRTEEAIQEFRTAVDDTQGNPYAVGYLGYAYGLAGRRTDAEGALSELEELAQRRYVPPLANALVFLGLGQTDEVFEWLDRAYEERDCRRFPFLNVDPIFDPLRSDPRFQDLLRRIGLTS